MVEIAAPLKQSHILFSGVNQLRVLFARPWLWPHSQQAIFAVQKDFFISGKIVSNAGRQADPQIDISAFRYIASHALGHLIASQFLHNGVLRRF